MEASHISILLVDDEPAMRQLIETVLDTQNWVVRVADGAAAAMASCHQTSRPGVHVTPLPAR